MERQPSYEPSPEQALVAGIRSILQEHANEVGIWTDEKQELPTHVALAGTVRAQTEDSPDAQFLLGQLMLPSGREVITVQVSWGEPTKHSVVRILDGVAYYRNGKRLSSKDAQDLERYLGRTEWDPEASREAAKPHPFTS